MPASDTNPTDFGTLLAAARRAAGLSSRKLAKESGVELRRLTALQDGSATPTDRELGMLAQACRVSVFDLLPPGSTLRVLTHDDANGVQEAVGGEASEALLREYLAMVVELRSGREVAAPTLRYDDLAELAAALGDTPEAIEDRVRQLLGTDVAHARDARSMILPSTRSD